MCIVSIYTGYKRVWHSGGLTTYKTHVWLYPDVGLGLYISTNGPLGSASSWGLILTLQYLSDLLLGEEPWLNTSTLCTFPEPWKPSPPVDTMTPPADDPVREAGDYTGTYHHPAFGNVTVTRDPGTNALKLQMGRYMEAKLLYNQTSDTFYTTLVGELWYSKDRIPVKFLRSPEEGGIGKLQMPLYSPYESVKPTIFKKVYTSAKCLAMMSGSHSFTDFYLLQYQVITVVIITHIFNF